MTTHRSSWLSDRRYDATPCRPCLGCELTYFHTHAHTHTTDAPRGRPFQPNIVDLGADTTAGSTTPPLQLHFTALHGGPSVGLRHGFAACHHPVLHSGGCE